MSYSGFFQKPIEQKAVPKDILSALEELYQHQKSRLFIRHRELEQLRNNLLQLTIHSIQSRLLHHPDDYRYCKTSITRLICNIIMQTKNYSRMYKYAQVLPFGDILKVCATILPNAFIDAILIIQSIPATRIVRITHHKIPLSDEIEAKQTITIKPRYRIPLDDVLYGIEETQKKLILMSPYLKLLVEENELEKGFLNLKTHHLSKHSQALLASAKELHIYLLNQMWDLEKIQEFKKQTIHLAVNLEAETILRLQAFLIYLDNMSEQLERGRILNDELIAFYHEISTSSRGLSAGSKVQ